MPARKYYSYEAQDRAEALIPKPILEALAKEGWNIFGVYETVRKEILRDVREKIMAEHPPKTEV